MVSAKMESLERETTFDLRRLSQIAKKHTFQKEVSKGDPVPFPREGRRFSIQFQYNMLFF